MGPSAQIRIEVTGLLLDAPYGMTADAAVIGAPGGGYRENVLLTVVAEGECHLADPLRPGQRPRLGSFRRHILLNGFEESRLCIEHVNVECADRIFLFRCAREQVS